MDRINNSIALARQSWEVLKADKELMLLPVISFLASLAVIASFMGPVLAVEGVSEEPGTMFYLAGFLMYLVLAYVTIFFNTALVHAAHQRLQGGDPTLGSALAGAAARAGRILPWALISATVSMILRAIEERAGFLGQIVAAIAGLAWTLVTFLVLPILVIEDIGVVDAIKRSGNLFKQTWGENVAAQVGFSLLGLVAFLAVVPVVALGFFLGSPLLILTIILAVVWLALVTVALAALSGIFQTALYHYAVDGSVPGGYFDDTSLRTAFAPRR